MIQPLTVALIDVMINVGFLSSHGALAGEMVAGEMVGEMVAGGIVMLAS